MLGHNLVTKQTKQEGLLVDKLYIAEKVGYTNEYYLSITIDRENACPAIIASRHGGMDIEKAAEQDPSSVAKLHLNYLEGITDRDARAIAAALHIYSDEISRLQKLLQTLFELFKQKDATLIEINPLVRTTEGHFLCLDAKFSFDNAAAPRQRDLFALEEKETRDADEVEAEKSGLVYIRLEGDIGNVVNGAGLAMATNDAISYYGGNSANFLDAGGQATKETMMDAFRIILRDPRVKVILVNIYGGKSRRRLCRFLLTLTGIIRCDMIAESIIAAADQLGPLGVPIVVRLQGTNAEQGQQMVSTTSFLGMQKNLLSVKIADCDLKIEAVAGFGDAARRATELAAGQIP